MYNYLIPLKTNSKEEYIMKKNKILDIINDKDQNANMQEENASDFIREEFRENPNLNREEIQEVSKKNQLK